MNKRDYATLFKADVNRYTAFRIRFTTAVAPYLGSANYVYIAKVRDYIVIWPVSADWKAEKNKHAFPVRRHKYGDAVICVTRLVTQEGAIQPEVFGKRYKVKRDKSGKIYICLKEEVER